MAHHKHDTHEGSTALALIAVLAVVLGALYYFFIIERNGTGVGSDIPPAATGIQYVRSIAAQAVPAGIVDISGCRPKPQVAELNTGKQVTFLNTDSKPHIIAFDPKNIFVVESGSTTRKKFAWTTPGVRHYSCDEVIKAGTLYTK